MNRKGAISLLAIVLIVGAILMTSVVSLTGFFEDIGLLAISYDRVAVKPVFGTIRCEPISPEWIKYFDKSGWNDFKCSQFTDGCDFYATSDFGPIWSIGTCSWRINDGSTNFKDNIGQKTWTYLTKINPMDKISIKCTDPLAFHHKFDVQNKYKLFGLVYSGGLAGRTEKRGSCKLGSLEKSVVPDEAYVTAELGFFEFTNYLQTWVYGPVTDVHTHPTRGEVWCVSGTPAKLYSVARVEFADGSFDKVYLHPDLDMEFVKPAGYLGTAECCPGETGTTGLLCGDDFKWIYGTKECDSDIECKDGGAWFPVDNKLRGKERCIRNKCQLETDSVECAYNSDCRHLGDRYVCRNWRCILQDIPGACGDGIRQAGENSETCCIDAGCPPGFYCDEDKITCIEQKPFELDWRIAAAALIGLITLNTLKPKKKKDHATWLIVIGISALAGYLAYTYLTSTIAIIITVIAVIVLLILRNIIRI